MESVAEPKVEAQDGRLILHAAEVLKRQTGAQQRAHLSGELVEVGETKTRIIKYPEKVKCEQKNETACEKYPQVVFLINLFT